MNREEFLSERKAGLGGSDMAAVLGVEGAFKTAYEVWDEKVNGFIKNHPNPYPLMLGRLLEEPLIKKYNEVNQENAKSMDGSFVSSKEYPFLKAHVDGFVESESKVLEIKTTDEFNKSKWGPDGSAIIPEYYYAQIAHYMLVLDCEYADLMVGFISKEVRNQINVLLMDCHLSGTEVDLSSIVNDIETRTYHFKRNEKIDEIIIKESSDFWNNYVLKRIPPLKDFSNKRFIDLVKSQNISVELGQSIIFPDDMVELKNKYVSLRKAISELENGCESIKSRFIDFMGKNEIGEFPDGDKFIRKLIERKESYCKAGKYVRLTLMEKGD